MRTILHLNSILFFTFLLFQPCGFTQNLNQTDASGLKQGLYSAKYPNGKIRYTGQFINGKAEGEFRYYRTDGSLKAINLFSEHGNKATSKQFSETGSLLAEGVYRNEKKDSIWRIYSDYDGRLLSEESYNNDIKNGLTKVYHPEGGYLYELLEYKSDQKDGIWKRYFEDGKLFIEGKFKAGYPDGKVVYYYTNGKIMIEGQYVNQRKSGIWKEYNEQGELVDEYDAVIRNKQGDRNIDE